ncbi:MAG TPA: class I SAM-dependent methyltransferase [Thermoanaerobaculia bacterium]|nr:class I SAM-dependent methyltransferase [Thermoanaerobaculia bacterium]
MGALAEINASSAIGAISAGMSLSAAAFLAGAEEAGYDLRHEVQSYYHTVAPYIDLELADRGDAVLWEWAATTPPGCRLLEVGAGTGRATALLARAAARLVAFDLSPGMLAIARRRLAGLPAVSLLVADVRQLALAERFDLAVAADDPLSHLILDADRDLALRAIGRHLLPGGRFILDAAWFSPSRRKRAASAGGLFFERLHGRGDEELLVREDWRLEPGGRRLCTARFAYSRHGRPLGEALFRGRLWSVAELVGRCRAAGLEIVSLWGGYDRRPWRRGHSQRLIVEARRRTDWLA